MHRAALAAEQSTLAAHQFAEHALHRRAARERMRVAAIRAERPVVGTHRHAERSGDRFLAKRQVARALDQVLQKEIVGALLAVAQLELQAIKLALRFAADLDCGWRGFLSTS